MAVSGKKAYVVIRNVRGLRADGSLIDEATAFYAFKNTNNGWKIYALSDITFPAKSSHQRLSHARPTQIRGQGIPCSGSLKQRNSSLTP